MNQHCPFRVGEKVALFHCATVKDITVSTTVLVAMVKSTVISSELEINEVSSRYDVTMAFGVRGTLEETEVFSCSNESQLVSKKTRKRYCSLTLKVSTHDNGGISCRDIYSCLPITRIQCVVRSLLQDAFHQVSASARVGNMETDRRLSRKIGSRTQVKCNTHITLAEWELFTTSLVELPFVTIHDPPHDQESIPRMREPMMTIRFIHFSEFLQSFCHINRKDIQKWLISSRKRRKRNSEIPFVVTRVVGDYLREESAEEKKHVKKTNEGMVLTVGSTLTPVLPGIVCEADTCIVVRRPSVSWDERDMGYCDELEVQREPISKAVLEITATVRQANATLGNNPNSKSPSRDRFLGFRWTRLTPLDPRTYMFDSRRAEDIVGQLSCIVPTITFVSDCNASDLAALSKSNAFSECVYS